MRMIDKLNLDELADRAVDAVAERVAYGASYIKERDSGKKYRTTVIPTVDKRGGLLFRIQALKDFGDIKAGQIGGSITGEHNLSQDGTCWIEKGAHVHGKAQVMKDAQILDKARVYESAFVTDHAIVSDFARVKGEAYIGGNAIVRDDAKIAGKAMILDDATVSGCAVVYGEALVQDSANIYFESYILGKSIIGGNAIIEGKAVVKDEILVDKQMILMKGVHCEPPVYMEYNGDTFCYAGGKYVSVNQRYTSMKDWKKHAREYYERASKYDNLQEFVDFFNYICDKNHWPHLKIRKF